MKLDEYQAEARRTNRNPARMLDFPLLGLFGETGSLLSVVKKKQRDAASYVGYAPHVVEELGDVLWYFATVASECDLTLSDIAREIDPASPIVDAERSRTRTFGDLQPTMTKEASATPTATFEKTLLDLAGDVGTVLSDYQAGRLTNNKAAVQGRLLAVFRTLVKASNEAGVSLEQAALENLNKTFDRWPKERMYPVPFDAEEAAYEQLPREMEIDIFERTVGGKVYVFQECRGINIGDRLTDNAVEPDDYRFHDVFHYAFAAVLSWSPVLRALLRLKRKSKPTLDEAQDGARAILIEEGVATWVFGQAKQLDFFRGIKAGELSFDMLKAIRQFVSGYEAETCPLWLWEEAILQGFEAFRFLKENRRGRVRIDMAQRRLTCGELA